MPNQQIKYFSGLNGLRFIAAYLVVLHHAEQIRMKYGLFNLKSFSLFNSGSLAVTFFFVLSGFLITYLLLKEQNQTKKISIKKFYMRRVLRIWPLYFLLVLIGTFIVPTFIDIINHPYEMPYTFKDVYLYFIFFTPFMVNIIFGHNLLEPLWSIGVEELFYLIWAPLLKFLKNNVLTIIISIIVLKTSLAYIFRIIEFPQIIIQISDMLQFEAMAIGGLGAYLLFHSKKELNGTWLFSIPAQLIILSLIVLRVCAFKYLIESYPFFRIIYAGGFFSGLFMMSLFVWLILNTSLNQNSLVKLNHKYFKHLGDISYGIYMYHMVIIFIIILFAKNSLPQLSSASGSLFFYTLLTALVIIVSTLSKKYFEDRFLALNHRYKTV